MKFKSINQILKSFFFFAIILFQLDFCYAQPKELPVSLKPFLLPGYEMLDFVEADLNNDKKTDAILILKSPGEDSIMEQDITRPFLLLIKQADGKLKLKKRNDHLVMCKHCGGVFGDPYDNISVQKNSFTISFYGGSNWRWGYDYTFTYDLLKDDWFLTKEYQLSYHSSDPDKTKESQIDQAELGSIKLEDFNVDPPYRETKWKVISDKAYFYDNPKLESKPRKGYLIKGDTATSYRELKNFVVITFQGKKETFTSGYVLKNNLKKIE